MLHLPSIANIDNVFTTALMHVEIWVAKSNRQVLNFNGLHWHTLPQFYPSGQSPGSDGLTVVQVAFVACVHVERVVKVEHVGEVTILKIVLWNEGDAKQN